MKAWLSLLFLSVAASGVFGASISKRQIQEPWITGGSTPGERVPQCVPYSHPICNQFCNYTLSHNPSRGGLTVEELIGEFKPFEQHAHQLCGCHPNIYVFLCFTYFPCCNQTQYERNVKTLEDVSKFSVFPCRDTCEGVHNSTCTDLVRQAPGVDDWAPHLQCSHSAQVSQYLGPVSTYPVFGSDSAVCTVGGHGDSFECPTEPIVPEPTEQSTEQSTEQPTKQSTEQPTKQTTEKPTEPPCSFPTGPSCPHKGQYRGSCSANTFKRNCFEFAARVNVTSKDDSGCSVSFTVDVIGDEDYSLESNQNGRCIRAPRLPESAVIHTDWHRDCTQCPQIEYGKEYLIAGYYSLDSSNTTVFKLECDNNRSLVSAWTSKYQQRMKKWLTKLNPTRRQNCCPTPRE